MSIPAVLGLAVAGYFALRAIGGNSEPQDLDKKYTALTVPKDPAAVIKVGKQYMAGLRGLTSASAAGPDIAVLATAVSVDSGTATGRMRVDEILDVRPGYTGPKFNKGDLFTATPGMLVEIPDSGGTNV